MGDCPIKGMGKSSGNKTTITQALLFFIPHFFTPYKGIKKSLGYETETSFLTFNVTHQPRMGR